MNTFKTVFKNYKYVLLALAVMSLVFILSVWLPNWRLIIEIISSSQIPLLNKFSILTGLIGSIRTNFMIVSASYIIAIAVLFGINIALLVYYIKIRRGKIAVKNTAVGVGGLVSGIFGIGCAACGTFILNSFLGLIGAAGAVTFLPFGGEEFGIIGVLLLAYSIYALSGKINAPLICESVVY